MPTKTWTLADIQGGKPSFSSVFLTLSLFSLILITLHCICAEKGHTHQVSHNQGPYMVILPSTQGATSWIQTIYTAKCRWDLQIPIQIVTLLSTITFIHSFIHSFICQEGWAVCWSCWGRRGSVSGLHRDWPSSVWPGYQSASTSVGCCQWNTAIWRVPVPMATVYLDALSLVTLWFSTTLHGPMCIVGGKFEYLHYLSHTWQFVQQLGQGWGGGGHITLNRLHLLFNWLSVSDVVQMLRAMEMWTACTKYQVLVFISLTTVFIGFNFALDIQNNKLLQKTQCCVLELSRYPVYVW